MRVALISESFLPQVNGVTNTVRHVVDRLLETGHEPLVVAPGPGLGDYRRVPVVRVRSARLPGYRSFHLGLPDRRLDEALEDFRPDVVHLASPLTLGAWGLRAARRMGVPAVAVYQTDVAGFARRYGVPGARLFDGWVAALHNRVDRTLSRRRRRTPSSPPSVSPTCTGGGGASTSTCSVRFAETSPCTTAGLARRRPEGPGPSWATLAGSRRRRACAGWSRCRGSRGFGLSWSATGRS